MHETVFNIYLFYYDCKLNCMTSILAPITNKMTHTIMNIKTNFFMRDCVYHYINKMDVLLPDITS